MADDALVILSAKKLVSAHAGAPLMLTFVGTPTDSNGDPVDPALFDEFAIQIRNHAGRLITLEDPVDVTDSENGTTFTVAMALTADQTTELGPDRFTVQLVADYEGDGPHGLIAVQLRLHPFGHGADSTSDEVEFGVTIGEVTVAGTIMIGAAAEAAAVAAGLAAHIDAADPHPQYTTAAELATAVTAEATARAAADALKVDKATLTTDGDLLTRAAGVPARITRDSLAQDTSFTSRFETVVSSTDYTVIQAALDAVPAVGGVVRLKGQTVTGIAAALKVKDYTTFDLAGAQLLLAAGANTDVIRNADVYTGNTGISILGRGTVDGNRTNQTSGRTAETTIGDTVDGPGRSCISLLNCHDSDVENLIVKSAWHHGVDPGCPDEVDNSLKTVKTGTITGTFTAAETVTGGTSGATGTFQLAGTDTRGQRFVVLDSVSGTFVSGETLTGGTSGATATSQSAALNQQSTNIRVKNVISTDNGDDGVSPHWAQGVTHTACISYAQAGSYTANSNGFEADDGCEDITYVGCFAYGNRNGFVAQGHSGRTAAQRVSYTGCHAWDNLSTGFDFQNGTGNAASTIKTVACTSSGHSAVSSAGFRVNSYTDVTLDITSTGDYRGLYIYGTSENVRGSAVVVDAVAHGIYLIGSGNATKDIELDVYVRNAGTIGVYCGQPGVRFPSITVIGGGGAANPAVSFRETGGGWIGKLTIREHTHHGLDISGSADGIDIDKFDISAPANSGKNAIYVYGTPGAIRLGRVRGTATGHTYGLRNAATAGTLRVDNTDLSGNVTAGYSGTSSTNTVTWGLGNTSGGTFSPSAIGLGTAASKDYPASGDATGSQVVLGNDSRLLGSATGVQSLLMRSGLYVAPPHVGHSTLAATVARAHYIPFWIGRTVTVDRIGVEVTATIANGTCRVGIYADDASFNYPGAPLSDTDSVLDTASSTGLIVATISKQLTPGLYWACVTNQVAAATLRSTQNYATIVPLTDPIGLGTVQPASLIQSSVTGSLPSPAVPTGSTQNTPLIFLRAA